MRIYKRVLWLVLLLGLISLTVIVIGGLERDMQESFVVVTDDNLKDVLNGMAENGDWGLDQGKAFFVEYRLQRDRVRAQEMEMLEDLLNNPNASAASKEEAEKMILELVKIMEHELLIENMVKALGFEDAVFFYRNQAATVMVKQREISDREFIKISEIVAGVTGVNREDVKVISRY